MISNLKFFNNSKKLPTDEFFQNVLYKKKIGYYSTKNPLGKSGDFITAPKISNLFSEIIAIWIISTWKNFNKPKKFNVVELGPGDGSLAKVLLKVFERFPEFNLSKKLYLYETSDYLKSIQKNNIKNKKIKWINNLDCIKKGPIIFFGNEFFDAIPIKQFKRKNDFLYERYFRLDTKNNIQEIYCKAKKKDEKIIRSYRSLRKLRFIEFPEKGLKELAKIVRKISLRKGCLLLIDYGYLNPNNQNTLQSVINHKKNHILNNLGRADVTSHVNFKLLNEFFLKRDLKVKNVVSQKVFLETMGIIDRANILSKKMKFSEQTNMYLRLKRLLSPNLMGNLFKATLAYKSNNNNFIGFK